jgi:hypothetical protein
VRLVHAHDRGEYVVERFRRAGRTRHRWSRSTTAGAHRRRGDPVAGASRGIARAYGPRRFRPDVPAVPTYTADHPRSCHVVSLHLGKRIRSPCHAHDASGSTRYGERISIGRVVLRRGNGNYHHADKGQRFSPDTAPLENRRLPAPPQRQPVNRRPNAAAVARPAFSRAATTSLRSRPMPSTSISTHVAHPLITPSVVPASGRPESSGSLGGAVVDRKGPSPGHGAQRRARRPGREPAVASPPPPCRPCATHCAGWSCSARWYR